MKNNKDAVMVKAFDEAAVNNKRKPLRRIKSGMLDVPEIAAVSVSGGILLIVILSYFFVLQPARDEFKRRETERSTAQAQFMNLQSQQNDSRTKEAGTGDLVASLERFENNHLMLASQGNAALYSRLNELIRANGLRNTAGPEYAPLEIVDAERANREAEAQRGRTGRAKQASIYPGTAVSVTVEGSYANLRKFISALENTRQFIIIDSVEIESNGESNGSDAAANAASDPTMPQMNPNKINPRQSDNQLPPGLQPPPAPAQNKRGAVSMRLEMLAYFRRQQPEVQNYVR